MGNFESTDSRAVQFEGVDWEAYENMGERPDVDSILALDVWLETKGWSPEALEIATEILEAYDAHTREA